MIRTLAALSVLVLAGAMLAAAPASACISCSYTPSVATSPVPGAKAKQKKMQVQRKAPGKKRVVKRPKPVPKAVDTAKAAPAEPTKPATKTDPSVSTAKLDGAEPAPAEEIPEADPPKRSDCMKFSPTAGTTVPVPCE